jgi:nucleotide-binding universal stress UspA family protein
MFQRILVPLDESKNGERAIAVAGRLARASGASIVFLHVVLPPADFGKYAKQHSIAWEKAAYETQHAGAARYLVNMSLKYGNEIAGAIARQAEDDGCGEYTGSCNLVVLADHQHRGIERLLRGKVARHVLSSTRTPVLVVHAREALSRSSSK